MSSSSKIKRAIVSYNPEEALWTLEESYTYVDQHYNFEITVNRGSKFDIVQRSTSPVENNFSL